MKYKYIGNGTILISSNRKAVMLKPGDEIELNGDEVNQIKGNTKFVEIKEEKIKKNKKIKEEE